MEPLLLLPSPPQLVSAAKLCNWVKTMQCNYSLETFAEKNCWLASYHEPMIKFNSWEMKVHCTDENVLYIYYLYNIYVRYSIRNVQNLYILLYTEYESIKFFWIIYFTVSWIILEWIYKYYHIQRYINKEISQFA